jgi:ribosomal protein S18 acetylase RimI-like enzyme
VSAANATVMREATEADLPAILELAAQPGMDDGVVLSLAQAQAVFRKMQSYPYYRIFVAEREGVAAGTYALLVMENLGHMGAPSAIVEQVLVAPDAQGGGIGTVMMHHAMGQARKAACYKLVLSSNIKRTAAHEFYDKLGFTRHGLSFYVDLDPEDAA